MQNVETQEIKERPGMNAEIKEPYYYPGTHWRWGFVPSAEIWNGRLAMIGFLAATIIELATGNGYLQFLRLLSGNGFFPN